MYFLKHNRFFQEQGAFRTKIQACVCGRISDPATLQKVPDRVFDRTATNPVYTLLVMAVTEQ
jgi:hypothetical protein